jgi:LacI family transcriptional regulator
LALDNRPGVSAERRAAVLRAAQEIGYERAGKGRRPLYGLVMEELSPDARSDGFIDTLIRGIYSGARLTGAQIVLGLFHPGTDPLSELSELASRPLDGLLVVNGGDITLETIDSLTSSRLPAVLIENRVDRPISSVSSDNFRAGLEATRHLISLGHERIAIIQGSERYASLHDRYRGYLVALAEAGIVLDPDLIAPQAPHVARKGYDQARALLSNAEPPTAIYSVSDKSAFGAAAAIHESGLVVGRDISLVGTDNVEESGLHAPPLTTFDTCSRDLGPVALQQLAAITEGVNVVTHSVVQGHLVIRESTSPPTR